MTVQHAKNMLRITDGNDAKKNAKNDLKAQLFQENVMLNLWDENHAAAKTDAESAVLRRAMIQDVRLEDGSPVTSLKDYTKWYQFEKPTPPKLCQAWQCKYGLLGPGNVIDDSKITEEVMAWERNRLEIGMGGVRYVGERPSQSRHKGGDISDQTGGDFGKFHARAREDVRKRLDPVKKPAGSKNPFRCTKNTNLRGPNSKSGRTNKHKRRKQMVYDPAVHHLLGQNQLKDVPQEEMEKVTALFHGYEDMKGSLILPPVGCNGSSKCPSSRMSQTSSSTEGIEELCVNSQGKPKQELTVTRLTNEVKRLEEELKRVKQKNAKEREVMKDAYKHESGSYSNMERKEQDAYNSRISRKNTQVKLAGGWCLWW